MGGGDESASSLSNWKPWRGVMFRDHADDDSRFANTIKVFRISDAFEKFLMEKQINFERANRERSN